MQIESIALGKRDKEKLVIRTCDGTYISAFIDDAYTLRVGDEISEERAAELEAGYATHSAKKSAAKSLARRSMSKNELAKKLRDKGFSEADSVADWFEERGYIDDAEYAKMCVEYYKGRGYGIVRIREELSRRGISRDHIDDVLCDFETDSEDIKKLIEKKLHGQKPDEDKKSKITAFLMRRGFKYDEIRSAMREMQFDTEDMN